MATYDKLAEYLLTRDNKISKAEIELLSKHLKTGGKFAEPELKFLAALRSKEGLTIEDGFDDLFLKALHDVVLASGALTDEGVSLLNKHVGAKSTIDADKRKKFFDKLKKTNPSNQKFLELYEKLFPTPKEEKKEESEAAAKPKPAAKPKSKKKDSE